MLATELMDVQRTDDRIEAVRQAASVQPSTCIHYQKHATCVSSELHCCTLAWVKQEPQLSSAEATPVELDEAKREGV